MAEEIAGVIEGHHHHDQTAQDVYILRRAGRAGTKGIGESLTSGIPSALSQRLRRPSTLPSHLLATSEAMTIASALSPGDESDAVRSPYPALTMPPI